MPVALLDPSVLIAVNRPDESLPDLSQFESLVVSALCYSEMRMGLCTVSGEERAARQDRLDDLILMYGQGIPYDDAAAVMYGRIVRRAVQRGEPARSNTLDRMIGAVAAANGFHLATRNGADMTGLADIVTVVEV